jgi:hypothetical protein
MDGLIQWQKSTYTSGNAGGGNCVEVAVLEGDPEWLI